MRALTHSIAAAILVVAPASADTERATDRLALPVPELSLFAKTPNFGEGLVFDTDGRLFVSDAFNNMLLVIDREGTVAEWSDEVRLPNGHKILRDGTHIVMEGGATDDADAPGGIVHLDFNGELIRRITESAEGVKLRWPNDVAIDLRNGGFYFTDPGRFMGNEPGRIFHVSPDFAVRLVIDGGLDFPNGIVLSPDGEVLYVAESLQNRILVFDITAPGELSPPRVFAEMPSVPNHWLGGEAEPDGIALDTDGRLYVAHFGAGLVRVFSPEGELLGSYASGSGTVTNLAFDPVTRSDLYVYAATGLSFDEIGRGGELIRLRLEGASGVRLAPEE